MNAASFFNVIIVGAGPAGLGCAVALRECGIQDVLVLDKRGPGASFAAWPRQMRLLTPSFHSNNFNAVDLNAITPHTSPAIFLHTQHPTGGEYARYLEAIAAHFKLDITIGDVDRIEKTRRGFSVHSSCGSIMSRFVIWAAGEFSHPDTRGIQGAEFGLHNSLVKDWSTLEGQEFSIIGGFESGLDAAIHLAWLGKAVRLFSRGEPWDSKDPDPSRSLCPRTRDRLKRCLTDAPGSIRFCKDADIVKVDQAAGGFQMHAADGNSFLSETPPIFATGFHGAMDVISQHFTWNNGHAVLNEDTDESVLTPGLFYSGPSLVHRGTTFCFIYKFRARFGIIARAVASRLGEEWEAPLRLWRERGFVIEDLACCVDCKCAVKAEEPEQVKNSEYAGVA